MAIKPNKNFVQDLNSAAEDQRKAAEGGGGNFKTKDEKKFPIWNFEDGKKYAMLPLSSQVVTYTDFGSATEDFPRKIHGAIASPGYDVLTYKGQYGPIFNHIRSNRGIQDPETGETMKDPLNTLRFQGFALTRFLAGSQAVARLGVTPDSGSKDARKEVWNQLYGKGVQPVKDNNTVFYIPALVGELGGVKASNGRRLNLMKDPKAYWVKMTETRMQKMVRAVTLAEENDIATLYYLDGSNKVQDEPVYPLPAESKEDEPSIQGRVFVLDFTDGKDRMEMGKNLAIDARKPETFLFSFSKNEDGTASSPFLKGDAPAEKQPFSATVDKDGKITGDPSKGIPSWQFLEDTLLFDPEYQEEEGGEKGSYWNELLAMDIIHEVEIPTDEEQLEAAKKAISLGYSGLAQNCPEEFRAALESIANSGSADTKYTSAWFANSILGNEIPVAKGEVEGGKSDSKEDASKAAQGSVDDLIGDSDGGVVDAEVVDEDEEAEEL